MTNYPSGRVVEIGDLTTGITGIEIHSLQERLINTASVIYRECLVIPKDEIREATVCEREIGDAATDVLIRFEKMPTLAVGQKVRVVL